MNICLFGTYKPTYARNTIIRDGLKALGHTVTEVNFAVADQRLEKPEDYTLASTLTRIGRKILPALKLLGSWNKVKNADVLVVLHPGHLDMPIAWLYAKLAGIPLFFDDSVSPYDTMFVGRSIAQTTSLKAKIVWVVEKCCVQLATKVIVDTVEMQNFLHEQFGIAKSKCIVTPLGANENIYTPATTKQPQHKKVEVFFFGLFSPLHGLPTIMEAIAQLKINTNLHFTILGDGYLKEELTAFAKKESLKNVTFLGFVPESELVTHIQACDIMLGAFSSSPTMVKVIPNKVFAGLACKKPVITAKLPSTTSAFTHKKHLYLCEPENASELATAITTLAENTKLRNSLADAGYEYYLEHCTTTAIAKKLIDA